MPDLEVTFWDMTLNQTTGMGLHASVSVQQENAGRRPLGPNGHSKTAGSQRPTGPRKPS